MGVHSALELCLDLVAPLADIGCVAVACCVYHRQAEEGSLVRLQGLLFELISSLSDILFLEFLDLVFSDDHGLFKLFLLQLLCLLQVETLQEGVNESSLAGPSWAAHHDIEVLGRVVLAH